MSIIIGVLKTSGIFFVNFQQKFKSTSSMTSLLSTVQNGVFSVTCTYNETPGGTLIFSHIRRLGLFFWVQNSEFQYFFGFLRKMYIFGGYEDFVDFFLGSSQNWASLRVISMHFRVFFKVKVQNLDIFWGLLKFQIFFLGA